MCRLNICQHNSPFPLNLSLCTFVIIMCSYQYTISLYLYTLSYLGYARNERVEHLLKVLLRWGWWLLSDVCIVVIIKFLVGPMGNEVRGWIGHMVHVRVICYKMVTTWQSHRKKLISLTFNNFAISEMEQLPISHTHVPPNLIKYLSSNCSLFMSLYWQQFGCDRKRKSPDELADAH